MAIDAQFCGVVDALSDFQVKAMEALNARFASLRRLADLLEKAGDLQGFIPDITKLIPLASINAELYLNLQVNCPFLNLPPLEGPGAPLTNLRNQVTAAYAILLKNLNLHPFNKLSLLQKKLNDYQGKVNFAVLGTTDFLRCLQAVCAAESSVKGSISRLSNTSPQSVITTSQTYLKNFVVGQGQVLSDAAAAKANDLHQVKQGVQNLIETKSLAPTGQAAVNVGVAAGVV